VNCSGDLISSSRCGMLIFSPVQGVTEFVITNQQITFLIRK
jgi:hypothetical protein